jgi:hypothetical protein
MDESNLSSDEMREIFLYHYLNGQLIRHSLGDKAIKSEYHQMLQHFSMGNSLFRKVTDDQIIHDIPLSLETDFKKMCFITINLEPWNELLGRLVGGVISLDIEQALADTFVAMTKCDRAQPSYKDRIKEEDDPRLYAFINRYMEIRRSQGRNLSSMTAELHRLKCNVLEQIMEIDNAAVESIEDTLLLDFSRSDKKNLIASTYVEKFSNKARIIIQSGTRDLFYDLDLFGFLYAAQQEENQAPSILDFIESEVNVCYRESDLLDNFDSDLSKKMNVETFDTVPICSTAPFYYLQNPFPLA